MQIRPQYSFQPEHWDQLPDFDYAGACRLLTLDCYANADRNISMRIGTMA